MKGSDLMNDKMTIWQQLSAMLGRVADEPLKWDENAVKMAMVPILADAVKDRENIIVAVPENFSGKAADISVIKNNIGKFILAFPLEETAEKIEKKAAVLPAEDVFNVISANADIKGMLMVYRINPTEKTYMSSAIERQCVLTATKLGREVRGKENSAEK